ncbi:CHAT domain-containing protein [Actinosynnema sp. NPDC059797]
MPDESWTITATSTGDSTQYVVGKGTMNVGAPARAVAGAEPDDRTRVLFIGASPTAASLDRIRADRELRAIREVEAQGHFRLFPRTAAQVADLRGIAAERPDLLHLSCHGDGSDLVFERGTGRAHAVPARDVADVLAAYREHAGAALRGIVLQSCHSAEVAELFTPLADAVVAWRGDLPDPVAIAFAGQLYRELRDVPELAGAARLASRITALTHRWGSALDGLVVLPA